MSLLLGCPTCAQSLPTQVWMLVPLMMLAPYLIALAVLRVVRGVERKELR